MPSQTPSPSFPAVGKIQRDIPALDALIRPNARIERLAEGFVWSEGPVWVPEDGGYLLLSDVPANRMYRWSEKDGLSLFLEPSGHGGEDLSGFREPGSNGLIRGPAGTILMADHGNRAIARLDLKTRRKTLLASRYLGRRFNSPNDLVLASDGAIYFTDPPYGLEGLNESPLKEIPFNGVYRLDGDGEIVLLHREMTFPNGIVLSPDESILYVANSDPERAVIMAFRLEEGQIAGEHVFADMTPLVRPERPGLPDGMAMDASGNLFATGPGGIHVLDRDGQRLGRIVTGTAIANCAFGVDGSTLFIASQHMLARMRTRTMGLGYR